MPNNLMPIEREIRINCALNYFEALLRDLAVEWERTQAPIILYWPKSDARRAEPDPKRIVVVICERAMGTDRPGNEGIGHLKIGEISARERSRNVTLIKLWAFDPAWPDVEITWVDPIWARIVEAIDAEGWPREADTRHETSGSMRQNPRRGPEELTSWFLDEAIERGIAPEEIKPDAHGSASELLKEYRDARRKDEKTYKPNQWAAHLGYLRELLEKLVGK